MDVNISPSGKHGDVKKTACSSVIHYICLNVARDNVSDPRRIAKRLLLPVLDGSSDEVGQSSLPSPCHLISAVDGGAAKEGRECALTHSLTLSQLRSKPIRAHLAPREKALSLFNPHYSRGADSIWWVSEPCSVHPLHSPAPTYLPFISSFWLQLLFFKSPRESDGQRPVFFLVGRMDGRMDAWMDAGDTQWWTGNMILQLSRESRICASFDCRGREEKVNGRGGKGEVICTGLYFYTVKTQQQHSGSNYLLSCIKLLGPCWLIFSTLGCVL